MAESERLADDVEYLSTFHAIVAVGLTCGLEHPVGWAINAHRVPGGSLPEDYYERMERHLPRYLCEMYELLNMETPTTTRQVLDWCDSLYPEGHLMRGYFAFLTPSLVAYLAARAA